MGSPVVVLTAGPGEWPTSGSSVWDWIGRAERVEFTETIEVEEVAVVGSPEGGCGLVLGA